MSTDYRFHLPSLLPRGPTAATDRGGTTTDRASGDSRTTSTADDPFPKVAAAADTPLNRDF